MCRRTTCGLETYRAERTVAKSDAVRFTTEQMLNSNLVISISSVARYAQVSRAFIHEHHELGNYVRAAAREQKESARNEVSKQVVTAEAQLRVAERTAFVAKIKDLQRRLEDSRREIKSLKAERSRWLGRQIDTITRTPGEIQELQEAVHSLTSERDHLQNVARTETARAERLERSLSAVRDAYKQDLEDSTAVGGVVIQTERFKNNLPPQ